MVPSGEGDVHVRAASLARASGTAQADERLLVAPGQPGDALLARPTKQERAKRPDDIEPSTKADRLNRPGPDSFTRETTSA